MAMLPANATEQDRQRIGRFNSVFYGSGSMGNLDAANRYADTGQPAPQDRNVDFREIDGQIADPRYRQPTSSQGGAYSSYAPGQSQQGAYAAYRPGQAQSQQSPYATSTAYGQAAGTNYGMTPQQQQQAATAWTMPKRDLLQWGQSLPATFQSYQPQAGMDPSQVWSRNAALVQQINDTTAGQQVGTYLGDGAPPQGWGQTSYNPQQMLQTAAQMNQQGWQNPFMQTPIPQDAGVDFSMGSDGQINDPRFRTQALPSLQQQSFPSMYQGPSMAGDVHYVPPGQQLERGVAGTLGATNGWGLPNADPRQYMSNEQIKADERTASLLRDDRFRKWIGEAEPDWATWSADSFDKYHAGVAAAHERYLGETGQESRPGGDAQVAPVQPPPQGATPSRPSTNAGLDRSVRSLIGRADPAGYARNLGASAQSQRKAADDPLGARAERARQQLDNATKRGAYPGQSQAERQSQLEAARARYDQEMDSINYERRSAALNSRTDAARQAGNDRQLQAIQQQAAAMEQEYMASADARRKSQLLSQNPTQAARDLFMADQAASAPGRGDYYSGVTRDRRTFSDWQQRQASQAWDNLTPAQRRHWEIQAQQQAQAALAGSGRTARPLAPLPPAQQREVVQYRQQLANQSRGRAAQTTAARNWMGNMTPSNRRAWASMTRTG